jgi:hypothetical protein
MGKVIEYCLSPELSKDDVIKVFFDGKTLHVNPEYEEEFKNEIEAKGFKAVRILSEKEAG